MNIQPRKIKLNYNDAFAINSEPSQLVFRISAPLTLGKYEWTDQIKVIASPNVDVQDSYLYLIYGYSFSADVSVLDYQAAIDIAAPGSTVVTPPPSFQLYLQSDSSGPILRQSLGLPTFYDSVDYRKWRKPRNAFGNGSDITAVTMKGQDTFLGSFRAKLTQTPSLIGKTRINLIMTMYVQEVKQDEIQKILEGR